MFYTSMSNILQSAGLELLCLKSTKKQVMNSNSYIFNLFIGIILLIINVFIPNAHANVTPTMIEKSITIDGVLDDAQWSTTPVIEDFAVVNPDTGAAPKHKTQTRML
jgi:hypothetical protein